MVTSTRKKAPFVSFDSARFVVKHPIYHLESSSDLPRLNAFKFGDVALKTAVSFIFPPLWCTAIHLSDFPIESSLRSFSIGMGCENDSLGRTVIYLRCEIPVFEKTCIVFLPARDHPYRNGADGLSGTS